MEQAVKTRTVKPFWRGVWVFFLGCLCFIISQPLTRLPLLGYLQGSVAATVFSRTNAFLFAALVALSAGVFEEGFRFLFKRFLLRPASAPFSQPLLFSLGHGLTEAAIVLIPLILQGYALSGFWIALLERALSVALHICLTVVVFNGFQKGRKWFYLIIAVLLHGIVDFVFPTLASLGISVLLVEALYAVFVVPCVVYAARSKKYYLSGGTEHV
ncbi:MAG TPA: YhfC family glutamic-type intramembrane protease [Clostridia bacterium]|nr:YhfC family glutamic-type intramembrane protease [Clostridia bacterium]